ncbi:reverse transcriptase domain-containing protein [Tanacetum coccineum]
MNIKFRGGLLGLKDFKMILRVTTAQEVIVNGDAPAIASASAGTEGPIPPKTAEQKLARKNELKAKSTLLLAIPDEHLLKFHGIKDAKTLWEAIKTIFRGNKESKKMQKTILNQLEIHGEVISQEDANLKLLRSLPSAWNNIALIMRNKSDLDTISMDDLYNNLKVYEAEIKGQSSSSSNSQNVAFVYSKNTSSTNEAVNTAHEVSTGNLQGQASSSTYADDVMFSFFANQSNSPQLDNEDLEQIDTDDLEEMDLKWQVAMLTMRVKCYNCHRRCHFARECRAPRNRWNRNGDAPRRIVPMKTPANVLVVQDGIGGYDWSIQAEEGLTNFVIMAYRSQGSSSSSSSDSKVHTCSKDCLKSYETLQKQYDQQRDALNKSNLEIICYQTGLESLEARIFVHEKNEAVYEEDIAFLKCSFDFIIPEPPVRQPSVESSNLEKPDNLHRYEADNSCYGALARSTHEGPAPQTHGVSKTDFERYVTANDAVLRNMQNQGQNLQSQMANLTDMLSKFVTANTASTSGSGTLPGNTVTNPKEDLKGITTRSGVTIQGPKAVNHDIEVTKDTMHPANNGSTENVQPPVVQIQSRNQNPEPNVAPVVTPIPKASIPFPSRRNDEKRKEKANDQNEKFYEIFRDLSFEISFTDALMLMPKFASTLKTLIGNKEKLSELARTPLNENCSAVILNKLPKKLGDPGRFLIPCEFTGITTCNALADLGASINLMPYSVWKDLALPELTPTCMTLELADRSITEPIGIAKRRSVYWWECFQFPADFVMFMEVVNKIDVIDMACDEYSQEVLGFSNVIASGNPTPYFEPIVSTASPTLTPFGDSDFLLFEEADSFLALEDDPTSSEVDPTYQDPEGDILILEAILNTKTVEPSIDEPPEVELKELPPHLEYAFLEGDNKLPVIIAKDLKDEEKAALLKVLKSHKRAIAWKLSDIKGVSPEFCTHKILMEEDYEPSVQSQRRVNPKIHDVIKKEVEKLLDAGLIYPISDSPWVSPVHCVPKKGGMTVITNEENELIPTRLVTGWRIPIDPKRSRKRQVTWPYGTLPIVYRRMPFGLCNAPGTFQRCMMAIFHDMIEKTMEVFMDDFSVFGDSFSTCLTHLEKMLKRCEDTNLSLNWEKSHFMVKEGIVLGHKISKSGLEVDRAKVEVIAKLPHPTSVKGVRSFLGHAGFYRRFIQDFSKIARPMTHLLEKETPFFFSEECIDSFNTLKRKLTEAPILIAPDWDLPFELMCDASDFAIGAVLGQRKNKHFQPIHYASKTMNEAQTHYTTTEKELLAVVYAFEKFRSYLVMSKSIVYTDHSAIKYSLPRRMLRRLMRGSYCSRI